MDSTDAREMGRRKKADYPISRLSMTGRTDTRVRSVCAQQSYRYSQKKKKKKLTANTHALTGSKKKNAGYTTSQRSNCTGRFKPSAPDIKQPRHTNTNGSLMEEKQILRRDSKEPHTDVTVPTFSQLCRGREDRARREKEEEEERKERKIPEKRQKTQRENKLDKGAWQGGNRQRESKREKGKRERNEESKETKQRPRVACVCC